MKPQEEMTFTLSRINISLNDLWIKAYLTAKKRTPKQIMPETFEQYHRDLGISTLYEFSELVKERADELLRIAMDEDN